MTTLVNLHKEYAVKVARGESYCEYELQGLVKERDNYQHACDENCHNHSSSAHDDAEAKAYIEQIKQIDEHQAKELLSHFTEYEKVFNEKERVYHHFMNGQESEYLDTLRVELLEHLAGNIIVKEHKDRYQKEQYERFLASLQCNQLLKPSLSLHEFCVVYNDLIYTLVDLSHDGKCPKIEANYDDFGEKTVRPLNATIFYYFFSMDRRKRTLAQWLLATIRYPNDRVRRAYMRFFA